MSVERPNPSEPLLRSKNLIKPESAKKRGRPPSQVGKDTLIYRQQREIGKLKQSLTRARISGRAWKLAYVAQRTLLEGST